MRKGELTRQAILDVAVRMARYNGLSGLTIGSLAAACDMSKSGVYAHFKSKEALQMACMDRNAEQFSDEVVRPALAKPRGLSRLRALVENWMYWYSRPGGCLYMAAAAEFDDLAGPLHDKMVADQRDLIDALARIADTAVAEGELPETTDVAQMAQEVFGTLLSYSWMHRILDEPDAADRAWRAFNRVVESRAELRLRGRPRDPLLNQKGAPMAQTAPGNGSKQKSTTVRAPWHLRAAFTAAERFAPAPAAKILSRMWFKVPGGPQRRLRGQAPAGAEVFGVDCLGEEIWGYDWGEGPLVYLVHGWGGSTGDFRYLAASLAAAGMRVVAFDSPSHGNSGPSPYGERHTDALHMAEAMRVVIDKFGPPEAVVAHSLGCLTAVLGMREAGIDLSAPRLALIAPFIGGVTGFADTLGSIVPVGPRILGRFVPLVEARAGVALGDVTLMDPVVEAPTLIVHDTWDRPNPFRHGKALSEAWPNARLMATEGLGHRKVLVGPEVHRRVTGFAMGD
ncbi:alpha/beta fold hydrolase [Glycomyces xiaoerkulensis]|uniref:alpha/beta fold hydrolase n=1 Tax=Glycomyces xiaoerkulensis TaxID=2038139 RepID=UPI000C267C13|nr:alpha/beta fold hydrolase [Glycomyces xiaoerkulensis]